MLACVDLSWNFQLNDVQILFYDDSSLLLSFAFQLYNRYVGLCCLLFIFLLFFWGQKCLVGLQGLWFYHGLWVLALQSVLFYIRGLLVRPYCLTTIHSFFFDQICMARIYWWSPRKSYNGPTLCLAGAIVHIRACAQVFRGFGSICTQISPVNRFNTTVPMDYGPKNGHDLDAGFPPLTWHLLACSGAEAPNVVFRCNGTGWGVPQVLHRHHERWEAHMYKLVPSGIVRVTEPISRPRCLEPNSH